MEEEVEKALKHKESIKRRFYEGDKKKFQKYVNSTTTHGVKHIFNGKSIIRRSFWAILFIGCLIGALHGIISSIIDFASIPTATTVYTDHVNSLTFPAVTVCNLNGYNVSYLEENNLTEIVTQAIYSGGTKSGDFNKQCASLVPPSYPDDTSLIDTVSETSQSLDNLIAECSFLGSPCNSSMFTEYLIPNGKCFVFNGRNEEKSYLSVQGSGFRHELELVLNIQRDQFGGSINAEVGALVSVHEQEAPGLVWESGIQVPVGHSAYLAVTHEQIEDRTNRAIASEEDRECIQPEEAKPFEVFTSYDYSFRACRGECITKDLAEKCGCLWTNSNDSEYRSCKISDICCIYDVLKFTTNCLCPVLCNHTSYEVVPSFSTFPSIVATKNVAKKLNVSQDSLLDNFLKVHVFYKSLSISREITVRSYSFSELIANIGGNMGLFLGASIISFTEFLVMIVDQIKDRLFGIRERKVKLAIDRKLVKMFGVSQSYEPNKDEKQDEKYDVTENEFINYEQYKNHLKVNSEQ